MNRMKSFLAQMVAAALLLSGHLHAKENDVLGDLGGNQVTFSAFDDSFPLSVPHGSVSLIAENPECIPSPATPCVYVLNRLHFRLGGIVVTVDGIDGEFLVKDSFISIDGPIAMVDAGAGMMIPAGTHVRSGARVEGPEITDGVRLGSGSLSTPVVLQFSPRAQTLTVDGIFPVRARVGDETFSGSAAGLLTAQVPVVNTAPTIGMAADHTRTCPDVVGLSASVFDRQGNEALYSWQVKSERMSTRRFHSTSPEVYLPEGRTDVVLTVVDALGGVGREQLSILVEDPAPAFVESPATFYASTCGPLELPVPVATSECGEVVVESDAPSHFYAGQTFVTWTARTRTGKTASVSQWVVVELADDPTCCPPDSNVIEGTSNDDLISGTEGRDCILSYGAQDTIDGRGGDDIISSGEGDDRITGASGADAIFAGSGQDHIFAGDGNDFLQGGGGDDLLYGGSGSDTLWGGQGQDQLLCEAGDDVAHGDDGDDRLSGGSGNDWLDGGINNDTCEGGDGFDTAIECVDFTGVEDFGEPNYSGDPGYSVCSCRPSKCADCSSLIGQCQVNADCAAIIECTEASLGCNLPHECSATCETGRAPSAIQLARQTASCMGGCGE